MNGIARIKLIICFNFNLKGHSLNVYDVVPAACAEMKSKGANVFNSAQEVAQNSEFVVTMLPNNDIVVDTYEKMLQNGIKSTTMFIDSSTIDPNVAKKVILIKNKMISRLLSYEILN